MNRSDHTVANELNKITLFCKDPENNKSPVEYREDKFVEFYNSLRDYSHNIGKNWWRDLETGQPLNRDKGELLFLMITELAETYEGIRKNLMDDHIKTRKAEVVELADTLLRILDYCGGFGLDIGKALMYKLEHYKYAFSFNEYLPDTLNKGRLLMDITRELTNVYDYEYKHGRKCDGIIADRLSRVIVLIHQYASRFDLDLGGALVEKQEYNKSRKDHSIEERLKVNGKKT